MGFSPLRRDALHLLGFRREVCTLRRFAAADLLVAGARPGTGIAKTPVFWERSAISERRSASRFETPSILAVSISVGNGVVILTGRAMTLL
jgi:hypothetical protein